MLAVYATMYVRDHNRPEMHNAMGLDADAYDFDVYRITTACTKQVFPVSLDTDSPRFQAGLRKLCSLAAEMDAAKARGGLLGKLTQARCAVMAFATFARLYLMPVHKHALPATVRMVPVW